MTDCGVGTVVVIHGAGPQDEGRGSSQLVEYLRAALAPHHFIGVPSMPEPEQPAYDAWRRALEHELTAAPEPVILVGHSLGGSVAIKYLSECAHSPPIRALFLVAAPYWGAPQWEGPEFTLRPGYAHALPPDIPIALYHSRDDAIVPVAHAERYRADLSRAIVRLVDGCGHEFRDGLPELATDLLACGE